METFLVRVWTPADAAGLAHGELRGTVEHVPSASVPPFAARPFAEGEELLRLLRLALASAANSGRKLKGAGR